ncbi:MAG: hypothetical protein IPJ13_01400 [Saprospiraceae bacterium]|nr:hypothetical protein [Saprospiraceae bacterium]
MPIIKIPGEKINFDPSSVFASDILNEYKSEIESYEIKTSVRGTGKFAQVEYNDGDLIYYEFSDGSSLFVNYDEAKKLNAEAKRSLDGARSIQDFGDDDWVLPMDINIQSAERGILDHLIPKFISFVMKGTIDKIISHSGGKIVELIAQSLEEKLVSIERLYRVDQNLTLRDDINIVDITKPILLFIHRPIVIQQMHLVD